MGRINRSPRYVINITGLDPLSLGVFREGEGPNSIIQKNLKKIRYFFITNG